ncbi:MAG: c-type cytochrome domain-containing protein [Akkermansiaceae bacterium]
MKRLLIIMGLMQVVHSQDKLNYDDHILPIFEKSCTNCHNPDKRKGDLDLSTYGGFLAGSSGGKVASVGDGSGSKIFATATHSEEPFMPPKGKGEKLDKKDLQQIREWIDGGLLETKDSKAKKDNTPKIDFSKINANAVKGPAPLPVNLSLEPVTTPRFAGVISDIECSPTAPVLAVTSQQQTLLFHTDTLELIGVIPFPESKKGVTNPESLSFHPAGKYLLVGGGVAGKSGVTVCWDVTTGEPLMTVGREYDTVIASSLRSDLKGVATGGPSRRVKMWDAEANELEFNHKKHTDWVTSLSYSHDGVLLASGGRGGGVWVWEAQSGNEFHKLGGHKARVVAIKWSPDSNYLATASEDGTLRIWNMQDGKEVKKIDAHKGGILDMDWSNKGEFVTVGRDGFIKTWKSNYGLKKQFHHKVELPLRAEWSHDGGRVFVADYKGAISVWDGELKPLGKVDSNPKRVEDRIKGYVSEMGQVQLLLAAVNEKVAAAENQVKNFEDSIKTTQQKLVDNKKAYQLAQQNQRKAEGDLRNKKKEVSKLQGGIKRADAEVKKLMAPEKAKELVVARAKIDKLRGELKKVEGGMKEAEAAIQKFKAEYGKRKGQDKPLVDKLNGLRKELPKEQKNVVKLKEPRGPLEKQIDVLERKAQSLRDYLSQRGGDTAAK